MTSYFVLGLMSGTSLDGLDFAYIKIDFAYKQWRYKILHTETIHYTDEWQTQLKNSILLEEEALNKLDKKYSEYLAKLTKRFIIENEITTLDIISSHGHTVKHRPDLGYTIQIGNLPEFGDAFDIPVVCDFRTQDVALGGQGAPLVPIGDRLLFSEYNYCLNLGGIANISFEQNGKRIAYDIGAVNMVLNHYANELGQEFDKGGMLAASGKLNKSLLDKLNSLEFYSKPPPKSLGREWVEEKVFPMLDASKLCPKDTLHTYTIHIANKISASVKADSRVLVTGGGAYNEFLLQHLNPDIKWIIPRKEVVEFKEALIFGLLGVLRYRGQVNCLKSYTGAIKNHSSGKCFNCH